MLLRRVSDGTLLSRNIDGTFSFDHQRASMPTTYYKYTFAQLINTNQFVVVYTLGE